MAENVADPLMQPEIILSENYVPWAKLTKNLTECNLDELNTGWNVEDRKKMGEKHN